MSNKYPLWKYIFVLVITIIGFMYAIPNLYGEDPAIQISASSRGVKVDANTESSLKTALADQKLTYKSMELEPDDLLIRFKDTDSQLKAKDVVKAVLGPNYTVALNLLPTTPHWLEMLGANPMKLGLDLRGGVHFLLDVDVNGVISRRVQGLIKSMGEDLRSQRIRYSGISATKTNTILLRFRDSTTRDRAYKVVSKDYPNLLLTKQNNNGRFTLVAAMSPAEINNSRQYTIDQTMSILRNRVNELGVGEAVVQQQGATRVAVDLPGIQDAARAKQILGGTATLEFHMVDMQADAAAAKSSGIVPIGTKLYSYENRDYLLKNQVILSGDSITSAVSSYDQQTGSPSVSIQLGGGGESLFTRVTRDNIGKLMSIVYVETKTGNKLVDGKMQRTSHKVERVISVATIQSALGNNFQITGLQDSQEARDLALWLRAGALPAAIYPVEERTVGPTLGMENIHRGIVSLEVGMLIILIVMVAYYRLFGLIANVALLLNLVLLVAFLSIIGATLTLPGIAGIVLTVGMAVDANVLIYERIREEMRNGATCQAAIYAGYERAFATIVDANVTTLIVAIVLFAVGTGPVRGFAVTLSIGLLTSMLTGITFTRAMVNLIYGGRTVKKLAIGI